MWNELVATENLFRAYKKASKGRRSRNDVATFEFNLEENIFELQDELQSGLYQHGDYHSFSIHDPKKRLISAANFRDRIVHHALVSVLEPEYEKQFSVNSYANRLGKGTHKAVASCRKMMKKFPYYLFMDVKQFFPSVDHQCLVEELSKLVTDAKVLDLSKMILKSGELVLENEYDMVWFEGDDLFAKFRPRGLPIGNMTSQFWANVYLNPLDQLLTNEMKTENWLRYVDDLVVFSDSKTELHRIREEVINFLAKFRLRIHEGSAQPTPVSQGLTFLGFRIFATHTRLKQGKLQNGTRKLKKSKETLDQGKVSQKYFNMQMRAWLNHVSQADSWNLRNEVLRRLNLSIWQEGR